MKKSVDSLSEKLNKFYRTNYKSFLIIPILLFIFSLFIIANTISNDGAPIYRDVSLKGGLSAIFEIESNTDSGHLKTLLESNFIDNTFIVSDLVSKGKMAGFIIDTDLSEDDLLAFMNTQFDTSFEFGDNYSSNFISPTLSNAFFKQAVYILFISFALMASVVFLYFRSFVPSFAVVLSAVFDIIVTIGVLNLLEFKISIAGIGALLMIVGYSIDTDVLLTNRVFKEQEAGDIFEKAFYAFKTGSLMTFTTFVAGLSAIFLTNSEVIFEIALILVVGLMVDYISTWVQNVGILLWWLEKRNQ